MRKERERKEREMRERPRPRMSEKVWNLAEDVSCPGCGCEKSARIVEGRELFVCMNCRAIHGTADYKEYRIFVSGKFHPSPDSVPLENYRYYDFLVRFPGDKKERRVHGWIDDESGDILQIG